MMDVNYFLDQAENSTQKEFELDWADVINVFDTNSTELTTECGRTVVITWEDNYYKSYKVIYETAQMSEGEFVRNRIEQIINNLRSLTLKGDCVDGETMQYILKEVGMEDQMLKQLIMSQPIEEVRYMIEEREEYEEEFEYEGDIEDLQGN
jgi:hypothetical protein